MNLKSDTILFKFQQSPQPESLAFSELGLPLLYVGDQFGNVTIWNLKEKQVYSKIQKVHKGRVNALYAFPNEQGFLSQSGEDNSLKQWGFQENEIEKFRIIRQRVGLQGCLKKIRAFEDDSGALHLISISNANSKPEVRDFSILNECASINFSLKNQPSTNMK